MEIQSNNIFMLCHAGGTSDININTVIHIEAISNYSKLFFVDGKTLVVAKVLKWFEPLLANKGFIRVHRSHLVNSAWINQLYHHANKILLHNNTFIEVSRRKRNAVYRYFLLKQVA